MDRLLEFIKRILFKRRYRKYCENEYLNERMNRCQEQCNNCEWIDNL